MRENINGQLFVLNYGKALACNVDPIEKKPLFHFLPGSSSLSVGAAGCNFSCLNCQNYDISQNCKNLAEMPGKELSPQEIVQEALKSKTASISYTYTEPTIFLEYALDIMKLAKKAGLKNVWVSNGFMSKESREEVIPFLDACNIDIKGFTEEFYRQTCGARLEPVLETCKNLKKAGIWIEITTLAIPKRSDSPEMFRKIAKFIKKELGEETPWHINRFSGAISWKLKKTPDTSLKTLKSAYKIGKDAGLKYVYTGNVPGLDSENTFCPQCGALCIQREGYKIKNLTLDGNCPECKTKLDIIEK